MNSFSVVPDEARAAWEARWECEHKVTTVAKDHQSNGTAMYFHACTRCGEWWRVKGADLTPEQRAKAKPRDHTRRQRFREAKWEDYKRLRSATYERNLTEWRAWYAEYLRSSQWRELRERVLRRANHTCEGCGITEATAVHHLTYDRVGDELLFDLVAVCESCHQRAHARTADADGQPLDIDTSYQGEEA